MDKHKGANIIKYKQQNIFNRQSVLIGYIMNHTPTAILLVKPHFFLNFKVYTSTVNNKFMLFTFTIYNNPMTSFCS